MAPSCIRRVTTAHSSRSPRYFGKITPFVGAPDLVAGPADALEPARDAGRALDLDDEVDRAHVDAELEAGRGDQRGEPAGLELLLDREPLLAGDAAVVGRTSSSPASSLSRWASRSDSRRLLVKTIVLRWLRMSSRIRGWIAGQMLVRMSPLVAGPPGCSSSGRTSPIADMSSTGTTTCEVERLARAGIDDRHLAARSGPAEEAARSSRAAVAWRTGRSAASAAASAGAEAPRGARG